jgi:hypothetical protein
VAAPGPHRTCALAGCQIALAASQVKYCSAEHHFAAQRGRRPNIPQPTHDGRQEGASAAD